MPDQNTFLAAASEAELPAIDHPEIERASITWLKDARLSGIDFRLYDPNQLNPDADRLSFVFLETEAAPFLDGRLVQVDRREGPRGWDHPRGELLSPRSRPPSAQLSR